MIVLTCCDARLTVSPDRGAIAGFNSYTGNPAGVVGAGELYKDPREKWTKRCVLTFFFSLSFSLSSSSLLAFGVVGYLQFVGPLVMVNGFHSSGQEQENANPGGAPESLTFKERQRLFSQGKEISNKVKASRKLMELENELNTKQ